MIIKDVVRMAVIILVAAWIFSAFTRGGKPRNPLSRTEAPGWVSDGAKEPASEPRPPNESPPYENTPAEPVIAIEELVQPSDELLASIKDYVDTPEGAVDWHLFGETKQRPYTQTDEAGGRWMGLRPEFTDKLKRLDGKRVLVRGYMFPLGQQEKQPTFLLGPFPVSCPFHYDVTPSLVLEVHAEKPISFSYDAVSIEGKLELVPQDDEYNVFYRLNKSKQVP